MGWLHKPPSLQEHGGRCQEKSHLEADEVGTPADGVKDRLVSGSFELKPVVKDRGHYCFSVQGYIL